jgi:hypothetical protein
MLASIFQTLDPTIHHIPNAAPEANPVPNADAVPDADAAPNADFHMVWQGEDDAANDANPTPFQAAMAYYADSSSARPGSPTGFDATDFYLADSTSSSPPEYPLSTAFATASDAADVFLSSSGTDSASSDGESNADVSSLRNPISTAFPTASDAAEWRI